MSSIKLPPPELTRLVTIVAHVDHGKTTLADNLIESNGIISERLAGTLRYMDSNEEEQRRGITMKSSSIALRHAYTSPQQQRQQQQQHLTTLLNNNNVSSSLRQQMVIHLIDSPGHVDFGSEVSSALLACDGALLVVDVVEGMCARTHSVLREAHANQLVPILLINKIDRLPAELGLTPTEAYVRIRELIESVNAAAAAIRITAKQQQQQQHHQKQSNDANTESQADDDEDSVWNFYPSKGNVVFCSALHGWGFTVPCLARSLFRSKSVFASKFKPAQIRQVLFGDVRYNPQTEKVVKWRQQQQQQDNDTSNEPIFAQYALRPLWNIYDYVSKAAAVASTTTKMTAMTPGMEFVLSELQIGSTSSSALDDNEYGIPKTTVAMQETFKKLGAASEESILRAILRRYRPLSEACLDSVCEILPPPSKVTRRALTLKKQRAMDNTELHPNFNKIEMAVKRCDPNPGTPTVAHVCKFLMVKQCDISDPEMRLTTTNNPATTAMMNTNCNGDMLVALVRVLSGTLQSTVTGNTADDGNADEYEIFGPKYDPSACQPAILLKKKSMKLYLIMGASLIRVTSIPAGHICAVSNLSDLQLKTMTLCDIPGGMPLQGFDNLTRPLVKVNVETVKASETHILERGLQRLSLADAAVEVTATSKGERILACQGELHLEKCILDLKKTYCEQSIELRISDPIADYGESTDYFEDETLNYSLFYSSSQQTNKRLRQMTVPPYSEEEGLCNAKQGRCRALLPERGAALRIRLLPLSKLVFQCLKERRVVEDSENDLKLLAKALGFLTGETSSEFIDDSAAAAVFLSQLTSLICSIDGNGNCIFESCGVQNGACVKGILSDEVYVFEASVKEQSTAYFVGKNGNANEQETMEHTADSVAQQQYEALEQQLRSSPSVSASDHYEVGVSSSAEAYDLAALEIYKSEIRGSISAGFQLAMRSGPFFEEPMRGVMVVFEGAEIAVVAVKEEASTTDGDDKKCDSVKTTTDAFGPMKMITGGMVVSAIRQAIRCSLLSRPARVAEAHLRLTLHTSLAGLGPLYAVLTKRRGKVLSDTMVEGTGLISITANLPQSESFGLSQELLKQSSGEVTAPELVFSHFEVLKEDPFWAPTSEDEIEEFGDMLLTGEMSTGLPNKALSIIRDVRKRKGLLVDSSKIVVAAEKQRTLSKKK